MKNNAINTYLKDLSKQLCCSEKEKKEILSSLKNRLSEFESEYPTALKYEDIVEQFGSPKEVANSFLGEYSSTQLHNLVKRRKIKHFCIITACILSKMAYPLFRCKEAHCKKRINSRYLSFFFAFAVTIKARKIPSIYFSNR